MRPVKIFVDFDGTITKGDVGDTLFCTFGGLRCLSIIQNYHDEKISAIECFLLECNACGVVDKSLLDDFIDKQEIDQSFLEFHNFCRSNKIEYFILSDGMDYYIDRILSNNNITDINFFSNKLDLNFVKNDSFVVFNPSFPYTDEKCTRCACCKRNLMVNLSTDDDIIIYIGEGYSDRCAVGYADIIFAKDDLLRYCKRNKLPCYEYTTFTDIIEWFNRAKSNDNKVAKLKKRHQAELLRRELFLCE